MVALFTTKSIHPDDPPDDHGSDRCPARGVYVKQVVISEVEGVSRLPLLGRMTGYMLTHARAHTHTLTRTTTLANTHTYTYTHVSMRKW